MIKYGFRYIAQENWGRLRRLFRRTFVFKLSGAVLGGLALLGLAAAAKPIFGHAELRLPLAIGAAIPLLQALEGISAVPLMLRGRYDIRGAFMAVSMALRLGAIAVGAGYGRSDPGSRADGPGAEPGPGRVLRPDGADVPPRGLAVLGAYPARPRRERTA